MTCGPSSKRWPTMRRGPRTPRSLRHRYAMPSAGRSSSNFIRAARRCRSCRLIRSRTSARTGSCRQRRWCRNRTGLADTLMRESAVPRSVRKNWPAPVLLVPASLRTLLSRFLRRSVPNSRCLPTVKCLIPKPSRSPRSSEVEHERQEIVAPTARDALHKVKEIPSGRTPSSLQPGIAGWRVEIMAVARRNGRPGAVTGTAQGCRNALLRPRVPQAVAARPSDDDYTVSLSSQRAPAAVPKAFVPPALARGGGGASCPPRSPVPGFSAMPRIEEPAAPAARAEAEVVPASVMAEIRPASDRRTASRRLCLRGRLPAANR